MNVRLTHKGVAAVEDEEMFEDQRAPQLSTSLKILSFILKNDISKSKCC